MPILGYPNSAANKDMMAKIWTNGDTIICLSSRKHCGKSYEQFLLFPQCFQKQYVVDVLHEFLCSEVKKCGCIRIVSIKAGGLLIQVFSNTGLTVY